MGVGSSQAPANGLRRDEPGSAHGASFFARSSAIG